MADGYARVAGRPGICFAQSVGAANLASGLQDAVSRPQSRSSRSPDTSRRRTSIATPIRRFRTIRCSPPVTKFSAEVDAAADLPRLLRQAWRAAMTGTPRPAHLDLNGLQGEIIETGMVCEPADADPAFQLRMPPHRPTPADDEIERAAAALRGAKRLAIVAGAGATASQAGPELLALGQRAGGADRHLAGRARRSIPTRHRLSIGCAGNYGAPPANQIVHEADMVLFVGCHTGDQVTHTWRIPAMDTPCVQIDIDPLELGAVVSEYAWPDGRSEGDAGKAGWRRLASPCATRRSPTALPASSLRGGRRARHCWPATRCRSCRTGCAPRSPAALPEDGILVADTGYSGIWTSTLIELNGTGQTYLRAAGSLGWSFPAALGAKCAAGKRKVICWSGDGAIYYHLTELETARRRGIAVVLVVNNNSGFGQGWPNIQRQQGNKPGDVRELVRFGPTNFADVARVFGLRGIRVEHPSQTRAGAAGGAGVRRDGGGRCRHRHRLPRAGALAAAEGGSELKARADGRHPTA